MRLAAFTSVALLGTLSSGCALIGYGQKFDMAPGTREVLDVAYWQGEDFDEKKNRLDLYIPARGPTPPPVLIFVHGGGWRLGDRHEIGKYYSRLGRRMAAQGVLVVVPSYRLAPHFKHPVQVRDVSRAIAWTLAHVGEYGGDPERVFTMGHSAGAHLVALAACDPQWLKEAGASTTQLKGVIGISGPYDIEHLGRSTLLGGLAMVFPAFGSHASDWRAAGPATYLKALAPPPFLVAWADGDPELVRHDSQHFAQALRDSDRRVETFETTFDDHFSVITSFGDVGNPLTERALAFMSVR